ncbi:LytR C-terminal domain-containing protein [Arthrobacter sp. RAF14]|uniref:LytR C-terminal domain-containing protein n=1 Tax=Arthrobacter sp. RAF14 TaxID=3233051 RepID=UPI003F8E1FA0
MTKYARDEFDDVPEGTERRGVHRVARSSAGAALRPLLASGVVALLIGLVAYFAIPSMGARAEAKASPSASASAPASASAKPSAKPTASKPAPTASATPTTPPTTAAAVDKTRPVSVYNGTTTAGLAATYGTKVTAAGWTLGTVGNWQGQAQASSVVFYSSEALKASATELASTLGIDRVEIATSLQDPLAVVLGPGAA